MRKRVLTISVLFAWLLPGCVQETKDLFPESATDRLNKATQQHKETLVSAPNGWVMQYFPTVDSEGYNLLTSFEPSGETTVACWTDITVSRSYEQAASTYAVVGDYGPTLTYDTYNEVMHMFSDPGIRPIGVGFGGDYEFLLLSATENEITLRGKKTTTPIRMFKCPENVSWEDYLGKLDALDKSLFATETQLLSFHTGKNVYDVTGGKSHIFVLEKTSDGGNAAALRFPFILTETGIRLVTPFRVDGETFQDFDLNEDKSRIVSRENSNVYFAGPELDHYFYHTRTTWNVDRTQMSAALQLLYDDFVAYCGNNSAFVAKKVTTSIERVDRGFFILFTLENGKNKITLNLDMIVETGKQDQINLSFPGTGKDNGPAFYQQSEELRRFLSAVSGEINIVSENKLNPSILKLTSENDPNRWLYITEK